MKEKLFEIKYSNLDDLRAGQVVSNTFLCDINRQLRQVLEFRNTTAQILNGCASFRPLVKAKRLFAR